MKRQEYIELPFIPIQLQKRFCIFQRRYIRTNSTTQPLHTKTHTDTKTQLLIIKQLQRRIIVQRVFKQIVMINNPRGPERPLFSDVDPRSQAIPVEINLEGLQKPPRYINDVHQTSHGSRIHIAEVIVRQQHFRQILRPSDFI